MCFVSLFVGITISYLKSFIDFAFLFYDKTLTIRWYLQPLSLIFEILMGICDHTQQYVGSAIGYDIVPATCKGLMGRLEFEKVRQCNILRNLTFLRI